MLRLSIRIRKLVMLAFRLWAKFKNSRKGLEKMPCDSINIGYRCELMIMILF